MVDRHIHIGQWEEQYYEASAVFDAVYAAGIEGLVFSSTTSCKPDVRYLEIEREIARALRPDCSGKAEALFWYVPAYAAQGITVEKAMANLPYRGFKIHPRANNWDISDKKTVSLVHEIFDYANKKEMPILIHTGEDALDEADKFSAFFAEYPLAHFILAHGRPLAQTLGLLKQYTYVYCDTAFMPEESLYSLAKAGFGARILPGSDFPVTHYFEWKYAGKFQNAGQYSLQTQYAADAERMRRYTDIFKPD